MRALLLVACAAAGCVTSDFVRQPDPKPCVETNAASPGQAPEEAARAALSTFVTAVERKDFEAALRLLDADWRRRYSAERLERDFVAEPRGAQLLSRLKASLPGKLTVAGARASLTVGTGRVASMRLESDGWHLASLDGDAGAP